MFYPLPKDYREIPLTSLAYIGDAVFELYVRTALIFAYPNKSGQLHKKTIAIVRATSQAKLAKEILIQLTEQEKSILIRGKNTNVGTVAKNASILDYRWATGFECLIGYLFYEDKDRLTIILELCKKIWQEWL